MEIAGYLASLLIGISLGLIGGGGSILTVPVMVYLFGVSPALAVFYSLFVVGSTSLVGAVNNYRKGFVNFRAALLFGSSSVLTVFLTRRLIIPAIQDLHFSLGDFEITFSLLVMVVFAMLMLAASFSMIRNKKVAVSPKSDSKPVALIAYGVFIGLVTGLLGAGGGFLLIPALVILVKLPMKEAIGTSLLIIAVNSLVGFMADVARLPVDWRFLSIVSAIAITGIFAGGYFNSKVNGEKLKKAFGWFVLTMGLYILVKEIFF